jgi:hypothetical protein
MDLAQIMSFLMKDKRNKLCVYTKVKNMKLILTLINGNAVCIHDNW